MKLAVTILFFINSLLSFSQTNEYSIHDLKAGKFKTDNSPVYLLPFEKGKKVFLIQGYESKMSHKGERALDFKVKKGTKICAAREDSDKGGLKTENLSDGNYISIQHADGSVAHYWHLKKNGVLVNVGDSIKAGQLIGMSGNTGYSAFPHLHFEVVGYDVNRNYTQLATRFKIKKGNKYLRPAKFYKAIH